MKKCAFLASAAITLVASFPAAAQVSRLAVPSEGYTWDGPLDASVGQQISISPGECMPFVTRRGKLLCSTHSRYSFSGAEADVYRVTLTEVGVAGVGNSIDVSFASATLVEPVTTPDCAQRIGDAILNGDPRSATSCLPAPNGSTYLFDMMWIGSDGSFGGCLRVYPDDTCASQGKGMPTTLAARGVQTTHAQDV
ncbi:MAG TPA: hypothetical protein VJK73_00375, partial [Candidatus Paceibacterota bacterium]